MKDKNQNVEYAKIDNSINYSGTDKPQESSIHKLH